jgi:transketolase
MRQAFAETLTQLAAENPRVIFLTGDLGFQVFDDFRARFGARYVNVGVAEAQMICAAAGLALEGWHPVVYSIASFITSRAFEQIRININYPQLPVVIVGAGGGYSYSSSGVTHHAADDLALMSVLPGMTVVAPGDPNEVAQLLPQILQLPGPSYLRIGKFGEPSYNVDEPAILGRARLLKDGERVAVVSTGDMASLVLEVLETLRTNGIFPIAYQMHTVKPLDTATLDLLAERVETIIVIEEHVPFGGLGATVGLWRATHEEGPKVIRIGAPDRVVLGNPKRDDLWHCLKYDAQSIYKACYSAWKKSHVKNHTI